MLWRLLGSALRPSFIWASCHNTCACLHARPPPPPPCHRYYAYWERRLFSAVNSMVVSGLQALHARMQACRGGGQQEAADAESGQPSKPLFRVGGCYCGTCPCAAAKKGLL